MQQLESSRLKLTQLEQELQRARQQVKLGPSLYMHCVCSCLYKLSFIQVCRVSSYQAQEIKAIQWVEMVNLSSSSVCSMSLIGWSGLLKQRNGSYLT